MRFCTFEEESFYIVFTYTGGILKENKKHWKIDGDLFKRKVAVQWKNFEHK